MIDAGDPPDHVLGPLKQAFKGNGELGFGGVEDFAAHLLETRQGFVVPRGQIRRIAQVKILGGAFLKERVPSPPKPPSQDKDGTENRKRQNAQQDAGKMLGCDLSEPLHRSLGVHRHPPPSSGRGVSSWSLRSTVGGPAGYRSSTTG